VALKLVARGRVVRSEDGMAAIEIQQYEFRTAGINTKERTGDVADLPSQDADRGSLPNS
jgi:hypothetical protein